MHQHSIPPSRQPLAARSDSQVSAAGRRSVLRRVGGAGALVALSVALSGCGFALRKAPEFGFTTMYVTQSVSSSVSKSLQRELASSGVEVLLGAPDAGRRGAVVLRVISDRRERAVVGQTTSGQVRELELRYRFRYSLSTPAGKQLIPDNEMLLQRDISFSEAAALAKAAEEQLMFQDMEGDVVQQVMRRLASVKSL